MNLISLYSAPFRMGGLSEVINHYKLNLKKKAQNGTLHLHCHTSHLVKNDTYSFLLEREE